jgi:hypothetical protein
MAQATVSNPVASTPVAAVQTAPSARSTSQPAPPSGIAEAMPQSGGSAIEMLKTAFQRMTASAEPGKTPDHTLALVVSALAFVVIGIGVSFAAGWSRHRERSRQTAAHWNANQLTERGPVTGRDHDLRARDLDAMESDRHDTWRRQDAPSVAPAPVPFAPAPFAKAARMHQAPPEQPPARRQPPIGLTPSYSQPVYASPPVAPAPTNAVDDTLRQLLRELDATDSRASDDAPQFIRSMSAPARPGRVRRA